MDDVSVLSLLGRLVVSLAIVLAIMAVLARVLRNRAMGATRRWTVRPDALQVVARQPLSRGASVSIVRAGDRALVVGVTDAAVSLLTELDPDVLEPEPGDDTPIVAGPSWAGFVQALRERSLRRG